MDHSEMDRDGPRELSTAGGAAKVCGSVSCRLSSDFNGKEGKEEVESLPWHLLIGFFSCFPGRQEARLQGWEEEVRLCKLALLRLVFL